MDQIKRAIERAKASGVAAAMEDQRKTELRPAATIEVPRAPVAASQTLHVSQKQLELSRIVSHLPGGGTSVGFDLLRTRVLQYMWGKGLTTLAVTSPTPACGKTVTSLNLAFSMARLAGGHTILVDLDLRKPQIAKYLDIHPAADIFAVLNKKIALRDALVSLDVAGPGLSLLPAMSVSDRSSELMASAEMKDLVKALVKQFEKNIVIFDMPPIMVADDFISFLPNVDAVLLMAAAGKSTEPELAESLRLIPEDKLAGVVLTKSDEKQHNSYYGYA